jgi:arylsulfatase
VLPLDARCRRAWANHDPRPAATASSYYPGGAPVDSSAAVNVKNRSHTITAEVVIPDGGAEGVLLADGGRFGGYSLY